MKFSAHQWAEDHIIYEESCPEIDEGTLERLAHLLERAYAAGRDAALEEQNRFVPTLEVSPPIDREQIIEIDEDGNVHGDISGLKKRSA